MDQLLYMDIIDYLVDNGNNFILSYFSSKDFLITFAEILKTQSNNEIKEKCLGIIKKWGIKFSNKKEEYPNFSQFYNSLLNNGIKFPDNYISPYNEYISLFNQTLSNFKNDFVESNLNDIVQPEPKNNNNKDLDLNLNSEFNYAEVIKSYLDFSKYDGKYAKLIDYERNLIDNICLANQMIDLKEKNCLSEVLSPLRIGNNKLIYTISGDSLKDEKLMEITLSITEDINRTINRYDLMSSGQKYDKFVSVFQEKLLLGDDTNKKQINNNKTDINNNKNNNLNKPKKIQKIHYINNENTFNPSVQTNSSTGSNEIYSINHNEPYIMNQLKEINPIDDFDLAEEFNNNIKEINENVRTNNINQNTMNNNNNNNNINNENNSELINDNSPNTIAETIYVNGQLKKKNEETLNTNIENMNLIPGEYYMKNSHDIPPPIIQTPNNNI